MEMTEVFNKLESLQTILVKKYELEEKIESSPKQLDSQDELLARLKKEYIEKNKSYEEIKSVVDQLKRELADAEASRDSGEKNMDSITSHREYEALEKQISEAAERASNVRRDLQKEEKKLNELNESLKSDEDMINSQESELNTSKAALSQQIQAYKNELAELEAQEKEITPDLNQEIVYKFQRIIQRNNEGIVKVRNGVCTGCQMILPGQFANEVRDGEKILFCPYCSRILTYEEVKEDEVEDFSTLDETGSLADFDDAFADETEEDDIDDGDNDAGIDDDKSMVFDD